MFIVRLDNLYIDTLNKSKVKNKIIINKRLIVGILIPLKR